MNKLQNEERILKFKTSGFVILNEWEYFIYCRVRWICFNLYYKYNENSWTTSKLVDNIFLNYNGDKKNKWHDNFRVTRSKIEKYITYIAHSGIRLYVKQRGRARILYLGDKWKRDFNELIEKRKDENILKGRYCKKCKIGNIKKDELPAYFPLQKFCDACLREIKWK